MEFHPTLTIDSIVVVVGFAGTLAGQWFFLRADVKALRHDIENLRRGRGLIMGATSDWPDAVRRCFGFGRGQHGE